MTQRPANDFKRMAEEAIADGFKAVAMYATMANMMSDVLLKTIILSIAGDEYGHVKTWLAIYALDD